MGRGPVAAHRQPSGARGRRRRNWLLLAGVSLLGLMAALSLVGLFYSPHNPLEMHAAARGQGPSLEYLMGTDQFGRDVFSRVLSAGWVAFLVAAASCALGLVIGAVLGGLAGVARGWTDDGIMRVMDALFAFPAILVAIALSGMLGPGLPNTTIAIGVAYIPIFARLTRASVLTEMGKEYVDAARASGCGLGRVLTVHVLPNSLTPLIIQATVAFGAAILAEAALSYLGLGIQPPDPSWGQMLHDAGSYANVAPWLSVFPGLAIAITVVGANLLGDGLAAHFNPAQC